MDKYLLAIVGLITFSIVMILFVRLSAKGAFKTKSKAQEADEKVDLDPLSALKADDFTLLQ